MTVYLVRHADAKSRANWAGDDEKRPLTRKGQTQASGLVDLLRHARVRRILSSPAVRCVHTVEPLASKQGVDIEETDLLLEGADAGVAYDLLRAAADAKGDAVLCTHGDLVPELLRLASRDGLTMVDSPRWAKGSTWAIERDGHRFTKGRYLPPPET
ncbi:MAG TPA: histidine phosphatase family protein [Acidimicrobiales bacterium]|jgi:8-oxo-dGTP diphosphatase|nr:histidine phosphatase family protein [Acidimicrobiales bacterium]